MCLAWPSTAARLHGTFSALRSEAPTQAFQRFQSPYFVSQGETAFVGVTIPNFSSEPLDHTVQITGVGFSLGAKRGERKVGMPGQQALDAAWTVIAVARGQQTIVVEAVSSKDSALPGTFHLWPASFRDSCGLFVFAGPPGGWQIPGLSLAGIGLGSVLAFPWIYARIWVWRSPARRSSGE